MPNRDGTGPSGTGRPGRGLGTCGRFVQNLIETRGTMRSNVSKPASGWWDLVSIIADIINKLPKGAKNAKQ